VPDLYDAVAYGMWAYSAAAFRVEKIVSARARLEAGTLIAVTHRKESDVPLICPPLYRLGGMRTDRAARMHFAARDDMFLPGFFAGFPPGLSPLARRLLYRLSVARWLPVVQVHPIRSASVARLGEVLAARPDERLGELLTGEHKVLFQTRARVCGLSEPVAAREALRGAYADLLWRPVSPGKGVRPGLDGFWSARAAQAARDFRALVDIVRRPATLVVFPEGRPSPDGEVGPVRPGIGALLRRGRPHAVQPVALAYDPLVRGRTKLVIAIPDPVESPQGKDAEAVLLTVLRRSLPLTAGQFAAHRLLEGAEADPAALGRELAAAVDAAQAEKRPIETSLLARQTRRQRLAEALAIAPAKPEVLDFLAREYRTARQPV
jgi:1-acyl-sn-glycerol-3-phosphate acyltransferase